MKYKPNRRLNDLTKAEINMMIEQCEMAAVEYADKIHVGMLSTSSYNIYKAIESAIRSEYEKAQKALTDGGGSFLGVDLEAERCTAFSGDF